YGDARAQLDAATTSQDYERAADLFTCALNVRPDFIRALFDRSRADSLINRDDADSTYSNFPTFARIAEIAASQAQTNKAMREVGWTPTPRFLNGQGFNALLAGFAAPSMATVD